MFEIFKNIPIAKYNCDFIDIRIEEIRNANIMYNNSELEDAHEITKLGAFIRIRLADKWYYSSLTDLSQIDQTIQTMLKKKGLEPLQYKEKIMNYNCKERLINQDNLMVFQPILSKKQLVEKILPILEGEKLIINHYMIYRDEYIKKYYINSKGDQHVFDRSLASLVASYSLKEGDHIFSTRFDQSAQYFDDFTGFDIRLKNDIEEAKRFINAPTIEPGKYPVILSEEAAGIFAHESFGHKSEADFMLGDDSMKKEWEIGKKVGSDILSIVDWGDMPECRGFTPFDDDGNPAQKNYLIKNGILRGRLHSEDTAQILNEAVTGNARAVNFFYEPIVRMTNTYIEAGTDTFESLIEKTNNGFYIDSINHGSGLSTFTLAVNRAWRIENGKITEPVKINMITGTVFQTLNDIDGLSNEVVMSSATLGGCGKNEQSPLPVSHGGPKVSVKEMMVS
ncbi:MAG TPA: TldD/PmbA family protein [Candidatus Cloacimonadota bacterium]|nr:TldD/PmbA family protein [Candidatus Cloacimonadota bacterium]